MTVLLQRLGLMPKLTTLVNFHRMVKSKEIAQALNDDKEVQAILAKANWPVIKPSDVVEAKEFLEDQTRATVTQQIARSSSSQELVARAHEATAKILDDMERVHALLTPLLEDIPILKVKAMSDERDKKGQLVHEYPTKQIETLLKVIQTGIAVVDSIKSDKTLQTFKNQGVINNGMSTEAVFDLCFRVGKELGHTEEQVVQAFARARLKDQPVDIRPSVQL